MSPKKPLLRDDLATLLQKFSQSDVVDVMAKEYATSASRPVPLSRIRDNAILSHIIIAADELEQSREIIKSGRDLAPIIIRPLGDNYEVVLGRRRYHAAIKMQAETIPAIIKTFDDIEMILTMFVNLRQSRERNVLALATLGKELAHSYGYSQAALAQLGRMSRPAIANMMRLLKLPEAVRRLMYDGTISYGHARALVNVGAPQQQRILEKCLAGHWSVRQLEQTINLSRRQLPESKAAEPASGPTLTIKRGSVTMKFASTRERDDFLKRLRDQKLL